MQCEHNIWYDHHPHPPCCASLNVIHIDPRKVCFEVYCKSQIDMPLLFWIVSGATQSHGLQILWSGKIAWKPDQNQYLLLFPVARADLSRWHMPSHDAVMFSNIIIFSLYRNVLDISCIIVHSKAAQTAVLTSIRMYRRYVGSKYVCKSSIHHTPDSWDCQFFACPCSVCNRDALSICVAVYAFLPGFAVSKTAHTTTISFLNEYGCTNLL